MGPKSHQSLADRVRAFASKTYVVKARNAKWKSVSFTSDDLHKALSLVNRYPAVCQAIETDIFENQNNVKLVARNGPPQGPGVTWKFELL
jgi:hypothetical protein